MKRKEIIHKLNAFEGDDMTEVVAKWNGKFPNLCCGKWSLYINGKDVTDKIPLLKRNGDMNTYGIYQDWDFTRIEELYDYEDGL